MNHPCLVHKHLALFLGLGLFLPQLGFFNEDDKLVFDTQKLVKGKVATVINSVRPSDFKQKTAAFLLGAAAPNLSISRNWSHEMRRQSAIPSRSLKIYEINRVFLI